MIFAELTEIIEAWQSQEVFWQQGIPHVRSSYIAR